MAAVTAAAPTYPESVCPCHLVLGEDRGAEAPADTAGYCLTLVAHAWLQHRDLVRSWLSFDSGWPEPQSVFDRQGPLPPTFRSLLALWSYFCPLRKHSCLPLSVFSSEGHQPRSCRYPCLCPVVAVPKPHAVIAGAFRGGWAWPVRCWD